MLNWARKKKTVVENIILQYWLLFFFLLLSIKMFICIVYICKLLNGKIDALF